MILKIKEESGKAFLEEQESFKEGLYFTRIVFQKNIFFIFIKLKFKSILFYCLC
jgi:hypothetical protein